MTELHEVARIIAKATKPEYRGDLWARCYEAIASGDDAQMAAIRNEFGSEEALQAALMDDTNA